ncbi:MAG: hypothetical protein ACK4N4_08145 [Burkholderiales bacterium]
MLSWDINEMSRILKVSVDDVRVYFTDGRRVSFLLERRIAYEVVKGQLAPNEGAGFDLIDPDGKKWEVRSITSGGIYFCPSYMVGSGRQFDEAGFLRKLDEIEGYIVSDVERFPNIPFWVVQKMTVLGWYNGGQLGAGTKISRARALALLR